MTTPPAGQAATFDIDQVRRDFPFLEAPARPGGDSPTVFLDSAASAQKSRQVLAAIQDFYSGSYANIHRGVYDLAARADAAYEGARDTVQRFLGADRREEIVFLRGATEAINLVAQSFLAPRLAAGDEVVVTELEHHSNWVPWQVACERAGATLRVAPVADDGHLQLDELTALLQRQPRLLAVTHVSNALGTIVPIAEIVALAQRHGVPVLIDGAQAVPHFAVDVAALDCDFYVFSSHKLFGPTGTGVLYGRHQHLKEMAPYQTGGGMIAAVSADRTTFAAPPARFEAGTPDIAGAVGLGAAIDYLQSFDASALRAHEDDLLHYASERLAEIPGLTILGGGEPRTAVLSWTMDGVHAHDVGTILASRGIAVRAGHHCAQPLMARFGVAATTRASFALYNHRNEVDALVEGLQAVHEIFGR
ncbi:MAG: SufS family cysteine desulfurase [Acidobacteriota bacterium]